VDALVEDGKFVADFFEFDGVEDGVHGEIF
jgi:hypothetical protein